MEQKQELNFKDEDGNQVALIKASFEGPLPPPQLLSDYERLLPGLADRITKMAENQASHRQKIELKIVNRDGRLELLGMLFAFLITVCGVAAGVYLIVNNKPIEGFVTILTPLGVIVGAFMYQRKKT